MKEIISKELLSEVMGKNITYIELVDNYIVYKISVYDREEEISIHELAHKCKKYAISLSYGIEITTICDTVWISLYFDNNKVYTNKSVVLAEQEIIFEACQWILDNK